MRRKTKIKLPTRRNFKKKFSVADNEQSSLEQQLVRTNNLERQGFSQYVEQGGRNRLLTPSKK